MAKISVICFLVSWDQVSLDNTILLESFFRLFWGYVGGNLGIFSVSFFSVYTDAELVFL